MDAKTWAAIREQAAQFGLTNWEIVDLAIEAGLPYVAKRAAKIQQARTQKAELEALLQSKTYAEVASQYGTSRQNLHRICVSLGVRSPRRPGQRPPRLAVEA